MDIGLNRALGRVAGLRILAGGGAQQYWQHLLRTLGPVVIGYWPCDDQSGSSARGLVANRSATYYGTVALRQAGIGDGMTAANTSPTGDIGLPVASLAGAFNMDTGYVGMWVAIDDAAGYATTGKYLGAIGASPGATAAEMRMYSAYLWGLFRRGGSLPTVLVETPTSARWVHIGFSWDAAAGNITAYLNGAKWTPKSGAASLAGPLGLAAIAGAAAGVGQGSWPGRVAHVVLCNAVPTAAQAFDVARWAGINRQVVFEGDSRTINKLWTASALEQAFPSGLFAFGKRAYSTIATSGAALDTINSRTAITDAMLRSGVHSTLCVWVGVNNGSSMTAQQIYDGIKAYCLARRAAGWNKIVCTTEIDSTANSTWHNTTRAALNTLLYADHSFADAVFDHNSLAHAQDASNLTYFSDGTHPTTTLYAEFATIDAPVLAAIA